MLANLWPAWTINPNKLNKDPLGSLNGKGIMALLTSSTVASKSTNSPGFTWTSPPETLPLNLKPPCIFANAAESSNALNDPVAALPNPPIKWYKPKP